MLIDARSEAGGGGRGAEGNPLVGQLEVDQGAVAAEPWWQDLDAFRLQTISLACSYASEYAINIIQ